MRSRVNRFDVWDYLAFAAMLLVSALTGIYFKFRHKIFKNMKEQNIKDYLTGNRNLRTFPVAMSLVASYISGVTMIGTPSEVFVYGATYWLIAVAVCFSGVVVAFVYLPVFTKLQVSSSYEYLEIRFNKPLRTIASFFFLFDEVMFLPNVLYVPSLTFEQVTGIGLHYVSVVTCAICAFYVILGGIRAVVYTDLWQTIAMFFSDLIVIIVGIHKSNGLKPIIEHNIDGKRLQTPSFNFNFTEQYTVFSVIIGGFFYWTSFNAVNQTMVQRYLSVPNDKKAKLAVCMFTAGVVWFISMCCFAGLLLYDQYRDCDPMALGIVSKHDQLLPLYVLETATDLPGIPGLFIAGVFGAALSSLSVVFNSAGVVLLEDFLRGLCHLNLTEKSATIISKCLVVLLGVISCALVYVVERMGGVFQVTTSLTSIVAGTMFGIYSLGMLFPWSNSIGAIIGGISGFLAASLVTFGNKYVSTVLQLIDPRELPTSVEFCNITYNATAEVEETKVYPDESNIFPLFRITYLWISPIAVFVVLLVGIPASFITGKTDLKTLDPDLISPVSKWILPEEAKNYSGTSVSKVQEWRLLEKYAKSEVPME